jgi:hypothetical protein
MFLRDLRLRDLRRALKKLRRRERLVVLDLLLDVDV